MEVLDESTDDSDEFHSLHDEWNDQLTELNEKLKEVELELKSTRATMEDERQKHEKEVIELERKISCQHQVCYIHKYVHTVCDWICKNPKFSHRILLTVIYVWQ